LAPSRSAQSVSQSVNLVDRWRYRSAVRAARVLNTWGGHGEAHATVDDSRRRAEPRSHVEIPRPRSSGS
jgi:hypothetical protein